MQNPAARLLLVLALPLLSMVIAGCSVSQLNLTDASSGSQPDSLPAGDAVIDDPMQTDDSNEIGRAGDAADGTGTGSGSTTRAEGASPDATSDVATAAPADGLGDAAAGDGRKIGVTADDAAHAGAAVEVAGEAETAPVRLSTDPAAVYRPGSCHATPAAGAEPVEVGCDQPHRVEVYAVGRLPGEDGAPFLGLDAAGRLCDADFRSITGVGIGLATVLDRSVLRPSEQTWQAGERDVICYVVLPVPIDQPLAAIDPVRSFGQVSIYGLRAGDCLVDFDRSKTSFVLADCAAPHDAEVFAATTVDGEQFPGEVEIDRIAGELCFGQSFESFVGTSNEASSVLSLGSRPTAETWAQGHRVISCILTDELVRTGSFAGTGL